MNKPFYGVATIPKSQRSKLTHNLDIPGPGSYDTHQEKTHHGLPKWSLKKRLDQGSCFQNLSITPGPGNYQPDQGFKKLPENIISTKAEKYRSYVDKVYSHSSVNLPGSLNLKGGFSFGYRQAERVLQKSPGPIYHLDQIVQEKRTLKDQHRLKGFGGDKKDLTIKTDSPGPGAFQQQSKDNWKNKTSEAWSFGNAKRSGSIPSTDLGPGEYSPKLSSTFSRSFKLRGKNEPKNVQTTALGPGSYDIPEPKSKIGGKFNEPKQKVQLEQKQQRYEQLLSPASYSPPRYLDQPTNHGFSLGRRLDHKSMAGTDQPGPGTYELAKEYSKGQGGYMGRKMEEKKKEASTMDNFYKYDPNLSTVARESPKFSFPQGRRNNKQNTKPTYSQCFYQSLEHKSTGYSYSMGTSKRFVQLKKEKGLFKQLVDYSTIGQLPSYLRKSLKNK